MKTIYQFGIGGLVAAVLSAGGIALTFFVLMPAHFNPAPPMKDYPKPSNALEAQRQDLDYFRKLTRLDRSFTPAARAEAERRISQLEQSRVVLSRPLLRVALMQVGALADNGHTRVGYDPGAAPMELPVRVKAFSDGLFVMRATDENAALLGGRLVSIDGHPIASVMANLEQLKGGAPQWRRLWAEYYLSWQDVLFGLHIAPDMSHSTWTVVTPEGATLTRTLTSYNPPAGEPEGFSIRWISSEPLQHMTHGWKAYRAGASLPIAWRDFDVPFRRARLSRSCLMFVQFKSNADEGMFHIADFIAATEADLRATKPCGVVLDLRYNTGGDYTNTARFSRDLPGLIPPTGRIYVLTSPGTFSAGITTAAFVKAAAPARVVIVGEPVGDRLAFYSEGNRGCLPNFPLCMNYETGKHDYAHRCIDLSVCYWLNYVYSVRVETLDPDVNVATSLSDWKSGRDATLERAITMQAGTGQAVDRGIEGLAPSSDRRAQLE